MYRKLYAFAALVFVLSFVPYLNFAIIFFNFDDTNTAFYNLAVMIASGMTGYFLYYRKARTDIGRLKQAFPGMDVTMRCAELGGVHRFVIWVGVLVTACMLLAALFLGVIGTMTGE